MPGFVDSQSTTRRRTYRWVGDIAGVVQDYTFQRSSGSRTCVRTGSRRLFLRAHTKWNNDRNGVLHGPPRVRRRLLPVGACTEHAHVAGKILMDRNSPEYLRDSVATASMTRGELIQKWHGTTAVVSLSTLARVMLACATESRRYSGLLRSIRILACDHAHAPCSRRLEEGVYGRAVDVQNTLRSLSISYELIKEQLGDSPCVHRVRERCSAGNV